MPEPLDLDPVQKITFGTVGPVGQRIFLMQARSGDFLLTLKLEKAQVAALSQTLGKLLVEMPRPGELPDDLELEPSEPAWAVGTIGVSYDESAERFLLVVEEIAEEDEEGEMARLAASREQVAALAIRGTSLVEAGRPPCPLCGYPLDPRGHDCPRTNGHRPPLL